MIVFTVIFLRLRLQPRSTPLYSSAAAVVDRQTAKGRVQEAGETLVKSVQEHIVGCEQEDDMCVVIVGRTQA